MICSLILGQLGSPHILLSDLTKNRTDQVIQFNTRSIQNLLFYLNDLSLFQFSNFNIKYL